MSLDLKQLRLDYKTTSQQVSDGTVYALVDGVVTGITEPEYAQKSGEPLFTVSGGSGVFVEGTISEFDVEKLEIGQAVTIMSYMDGLTYMGSIVEISHLPAAGYAYYGGNQNSTAYPFKVYVADGKSLRVGYWVSMTLEQNSSQNGGLYIYKAFLREDADGGWYAWVQNGEGRLEKRALTVGGTLWGNYLEIRDGLSADDYLAFPYGKNLKEGVKTIERDAQYFYNIHY
jgi:hypothetical protein